MELKLEQTNDQTQPRRCVMCHDGEQGTELRCEPCGALYHKECLPRVCATLGCSEILREGRENRDEDLEGHFQRAYAAVQTEAEQRRRDARDWRLQGIVFGIIIIIVLLIIWGPNLLENYSQMKR